MSNGQVSDGGRTSYYELPEYATELQHLIEHRKMNFSVGNIFKAAYRLGMKAGVSKRYDLRKIIQFAQFELDRMDRDGEPEPALVELMAAPAPWAGDVAATLQLSAPAPKAAPGPSPGVTQAFGLGAAPEGKAPAFPMAWADRPKVPEEIPDWPFDYRPRALAVPASRTYANADGKVNGLAQKRDQILIYHDTYGWVWRQIRDVSVTMDGRKYNVSTDGISVSILMVPHDHVMAIRTTEGLYIGSNDRTA